MGAKQINLTGFNQQGFVKALDALSIEYERTISNAKARSQSKPSVDSSDKRRNSLLGYTEDEWRRAQQGMLGD